MDDKLDDQMKQMWFPKGGRGAEFDEEKDKGQGKGSKGESDSSEGGDEGGDSPALKRRKIQGGSSSSK